MSEKVGEVTDQSFEAEVLQTATPVLVDFWAEWCGPCRMLAPTIDEVADQFDGSVKVVKFDVDNSTSVPSRLGVRTIPTMILFKDGAEQERLIGNQPKTAIAQMIGRHVG